MNTANKIAPSNIIVIVTYMSVCEGGNWPYPMHNICETALNNDQPYWATVSVLLLSWRPRVRTQVSFGNWSTIGTINCMHADIWAYIRMIKKAESTLFLVFNAFNDLNLMIWRYFLKTRTEKCQGTIIWQIEHFIPLMHVSPNSWDAQKTQKLKQFS